MLQVVGVGYADATLHKFGVSQFNDNDQYSNLEVIILFSLSLEETYNIFVCLKIIHVIKYQVFIFNIVLLHCF